MHPSLRPLILASSSPRRHALLRQLGEPFEILTPEVDETFGAGSVTEAVEEVARRKADAVRGLRDRGTVLAADTVVEVHGEVLGKPIDAAHAMAMLRRLSGTSHQVHTGVAVLRLEGGHCRSGVDTTQIRMRPLADREIEAYVASGEPFGKAGAYAVQETGDQFMESLTGAYDNVVGLPLALVRRLLGELAGAAS